MSYEQFDRRISVTIGSLFSDVGTKLSNIRIRLDLLKTNNRKSNTGTIQVYNLADSTISEFQKQENLGVTVRAGYKDHTDVVFIGVVMGMSVTYTGTDKILNIKVVDGVVNSANVWFKKSYGKNTDPYDIIGDVVAEMQLSNEDLKVGNVSGSPAALYKNGFTWNGTCGDCLTRICANRDLQWFISDSTIHIIDKDTSIKVDDVTLLTPVNGLVNSPMFHEQVVGKRKDKRKERGVKVKFLLNPEVQVGKEIAVQSKFFDSHYLVSKLRITADNTEGDFIMEATAINEWL